MDREEVEVLAPVTRPDAGRKHRRPSCRRVKGRRVEEMEEVVRKSMNSAAQSAVSIQNQATRNVAAMSAANSELWGATQVALAVSNGNAAQSKFNFIFVRYFLLTRCSGSLILNAGTGKVVLAVVACSLMFKRHQYKISLVTVGNSADLVWSSPC